MAVIEERRNKSGSSWRVTWYKQGKRQPPITLKSRQEAEDWKRLIELHRGDQDAAGRDLARVKHTGPSLDDVFEHWIERHRGTPYTRQNYQSYWRLHLSPAIGSYPVSSLAADDIRAIVTTLEDKGRAPKTIRNIVGTLSPVLSHAVKYRWLDASPWDDALLPRAKTQKVERDQFLSLQEVDLIISGLCNPTPYRIMLATGLRPQELCALDVSDVNLTAQQPSIRVTKAIKQDREQGDYIGEPKSERAVRTVGLPPSAVEELRPLVEGRPPSAPLFTQAAGPGKNAQRVRLRRKRMYQTWQRRVGKLRKPGIDTEGQETPAPLTKKPDLYALRHTHASLMLDAGMEIWQLSRHLGHSSVNVTEKHYAHLKPDAHYQAANFAAKALGGGTAELAAS
ncbi:tyrosine-type recombinase/integrase [Nesterenkonia sp. HG001]|uniref:tyrosine-type recombinase/integrase n=1 Tax=Nesterenkonia sp. HG001 TaxID=2983207 RepID=UPI002AC57A8F|nr:tyrosine-type recombinase/integrase [Nesterenkonia sp. HG001]MDZ5077850.1 site-specific integrase [Nesterenkonia sp. HG001]